MAATVIVLAMKTTKMAQSFERKTEGRKEWLFKATAFSSVDAANMGSRKHHLFYAAKAGSGGGGGSGGLEGGDGLMMKVAGCCGRFGNAVCVH